MKAPGIVKKYVSKNLPSTCSEETNMKLCNVDNKDKKNAVLISTILKNMGSIALFCFVITQNCLLCDRFLAKTTNTENPCKNRSFRLS